MKVDIVAKVDVTIEDYDDLKKAADILDGVVAKLKELKENGFTPLTDKIDYPVVIDRIYESADAIVNWLNE